MTRRIVTFASALLFVCLSACGGGGSGSSPVPNGASSNASATGSALILIPAVSPDAAQRNAAFVSPSSSSVGISVNGGASTFADISATSTLCTAASTNTTLPIGRSCTVPFTAAAGSDAIAFTLYSGANGSGNVLGTGAATANVVGGQSFNVPVSVGGIVATVAVTSNASFTQGTTGTAQVAVSAQDSSGNTIIGSAPYSSPITLTDNDTSGSTSLSTTTVTSPATVVTLSYNGGTVTGGKFLISATATNVASTSVMPATVIVAPSLGACAQHFGATTHLYAANDAGADTLEFTPPYTSSSVGTSINSEGNPVAIKVDSTGNLFVAPYGSSSGTSNAGDVLEFTQPFTSTPAATIGAGQFHGPRGIAIDGSHDLFVTDGGNNRVLEFVPPYTAAPTVLASGISSPYAIALAPNCNMFVTTGATVVEYAPPYTGSPIATITASLSNPLGLIFDPAGDLFVSDVSTNVVNEYAAPYTSAPETQISLPSGSAAFGLAIDQSNDLFVCEYGHSSIAEYAPPYTGAPLVTIGSGSGLSLPADIAVGP